MLYILNNRNRNRRGRTPPAVGAGPSVHPPIVSPRRGGRWVCVLVCQTIPRRERPRRSMQTGSLGGMGASPACRRQWVAGTPGVLLVRPRVVLSGRRASSSLRFSIACPRIPRLCAGARGVPAGGPLGRPLGGSTAGMLVVATHWGAVGCGVGC